MRTGCCVGMGTGICEEVLFLQSWRLGISGSRVDGNVGGGNTLCHAFELHTSQHCEIVLFTLLAGFESV